MASAKEHSYDSASVTTSNSNPYSKVAITPQSSMFATVQLSGNKPGTFALQTWQGANLDTANVPDVLEADLYYPINIGTDISYYNGLGLSPEWNTYYVNVANNSAKFGEYDVDLITDRYKIGNGDSIEIQLDSGVIPEVDIIVERQGIYQIWHNDVGLTLTIISPSGKSVSARQAQLPDHQFGGTTLGRYFYFAAFEIGKYKMTFTTGASTVNLRCEYFKSKTIRSGASISDGIEPGSSEILNPEYQKYVYEMNIDLLNYYVYSLNFDFNDPGVNDRRIFYETASASSTTALNTGDNQLYSPLGGSKIYIVIDTPDYFTWASPGVAESGVPKFTLEFNEIKSDRVDFGETEMIVVSQQDYVVSRFIKTRKPGIISLQFESVGPSSPNLIHGVPYIQEIVDDQILTPQVYDPIYATGGNYSINILLSKGTYKFGFSHTGYLGNEYLRLTTAFTEADETSVIVRDPAVPLTSGQFQDIRLTGWSNMPDPDGATHGNAFTLDVDENFRDYGYNITFDPAKNGQIFNVDLVPNLEVLFDDTTNVFVDHTGNASLPIKTTGGTVGDAFIIGSYDKFSSVQVSLGTASDTDAFVWQYLSSGTTWVNFDSGDNFIDGTLTGSGSLQQSGLISWDPAALTNWNYETSTSDDVGNEIPSTNDRNLYMVRLVCNNSAASVPTVNNFSLKKYVRIDFDVYNEFGYDVGPLGDPYFDEFSSVTVTNVIVDNVDESYSIGAPILGLNYNFNYETAFLFLSTNDMEFRNYNGSNTGVLEELTANIVFSVSIYRNNDWIQQEYKLGKDAPTTHSADVNYTTVPYGHTLVYNASDVNLAYVKLIPARNHQFDWTQITMRVTNGTVNDVFYYLPWSLENYAMRTDSLYDYTFTSSLAQHSLELGFVTEYILMEFDINPTELDGIVTVELYAGHFGYEMITFKVSGFVWTWYYTVGAVGLAAIVGGVVAFFLLRKKKRGY
jgi:hypothetical protein